MKDFLSELKRRRVFRVVLIYVVIAPTLIAFASDAFPALGLPGWALTLVVVLAILGFPLAVGLAWAFDVTPQGIERTSERERPFPSALPTSTPPGGSEAPAGSGYDPLREDARWEPLLARAGFPEDAIRRSRELYARRKSAAAAREVMPPR